MITTTKMGSHWELVELDQPNGIIFIEDVNGPMTVTNDAEEVYRYISANYGRRYRIVYKDSENEWWEMKYGWTAWGRQMQFEKWHGMMWDKLKGNV